MTYDEHIQLAEMWALRAEQAIKNCYGGVHYTPTSPSIINIDRVDVFYDEMLRASFNSFHAAALTHATIANALALAGKDRL